MLTVQNTIEAIADLDKEAMEQTKKRLDNLTKPPGSLGKLEEIAIRLSGITRHVQVPVDKRQVIVMAGDHGVVAEGVSAFPQEVTGQMVLNFIHGGAAINVLARQARFGIRLVDVGMVATVDHPLLTRKKVKPGTDNFTKGPAMSREEAVRALEVGIEIAEEACNAGIQILATGEMGIGNTTASSALLVAFSGISPADAVGRGTGVDDHGLQRKIKAIEQGIALNKPNPQDPLDVLAKVGGLEIAGLAGVLLGAAAHRIPVIIDGFISSAAALVASRLCQMATGYMIASHASAEPGHSRVLKEIGLEPVLTMNMRLGEGTGAVLAMHVVEAAERILEGMATFDTAGVSKG